MATISPRLSLPAAHEYVRAPADMHPRLVGLTSPNITNTGLKSSPASPHASNSDSLQPARRLILKELQVNRSSARLTSRTMT